MSQTRQPIRTGTQNDNSVERSSLDGRGYEDRHAFATMSGGILGKCWSGGDTFLAGRAAIY